ncbi:tyrosine-type recombinase/integrase [Gimibacter soli]|uniref:Site-specific integrase n=1 Tax=Gimibacter soli TaxID=3024400 RepID=A0AAE9XNW6_9PROT|nr:site-specific integrase [Gimibacter soli]WCL53497.1 site-specific integrase [Gimibacter soli]
MATIRKRGETWRVEVRRKGVTESRSFTKKMDAQAWALALEAEIDGGAYRASRAGTKTVGDAFSRYGKEVSCKKRSHLAELRRLAYLSNCDLAKVRLVDLATPDVAAWRDMRLKEVATSTVNRDLNLISHVFTICVKEWHWLRTNPCSDLQRPKDPPPRERRVSASELELIRHVFDYETDTVPRTQQQHVCLMFLIAIETAMRLSEIHSVGKGSFNAASNVVQLPLTKNGTRRRIGVSARAAELIDLFLRSSVRSTPHNLSKCFENGIKRSGIIDLTFHDSRHEAITRLARKVGVLDLARITGHKDIRELMTYYDATPDEIAARLD